jgi:two-component system response regulator RegX3
MSSLLIIEDDTQLIDVMTVYLQRDGHQVYWAEDGLTGLQAKNRLKPDLIILDIMIPGMDGLTVCREIRKDSITPILMISAKRDVPDRVEGLRLGADDYLCKPFSMNELVARINSLLRRHGYIQANQVNGGAIAPPYSAAIRLDLERHVICVQGHEVELTYSEFVLMKAFFSHPRKVFSREELLAIVKGEEQLLVTDRAIDLHITKLRKKIEQDSRNPQYIKTAWGIGYKFVLEGADEL